jgi:simple sugar transport system permease protein
LKPDNGIRRPRLRYTRTMTFVIVFAAAFLVMAALEPRRFLSSTNLLQTAFQIPEFGILALGMMVVMVTGGIDLSIISVANLSGIISAIVLTYLSSSGAMDLSHMLGGIMAGAEDVPLATGPLDLRMFFIIAAAVATSIAVGGLCGLLNGFLVSRVGIPAILATLGTMKLFEGIAMVITRGSPITNFPSHFVYLGSGSLFHVPVPLLIFVVCIALVALLMRRSRLGFSIYAVGENPVAARFSGLKNSSILLRTYMISGLMAGLAAIVIMSRVDSVKVGYGSSYLLKAVLVAILGGVSVRGGVGNVSGVVLGIVILRTIESGFNLAGFSNYSRNVIWGSMLILVTIINLVYPKVAVAVRLKLQKDNNQRVTTHQGG